MTLAELLLVVFIVIPAVCFVGGLVLAGLALVCQEIAHLFRGR